MKGLTIKNSAKSISFSDIPLADNYREFSEFVRKTLECEHCHTLHYFAYREAERLLLIICIANDAASTIEIAGCPLQDEKIETLGITAVDRFEREIAENNGIEFIGHKWTKPLRTAPDDYPFFRSDNEGFHEVGVGPIHAGVIEPGHFRFTCNGETIKNLEIMLGYQHRGVESLMLEKPMLSQKAMLAESAAGDSACSYGVAFASVYEALSDFEPCQRVKIERMIACELERIAIHTGDLAAICGDVAYQLGNAVYGRLRTPIINFMQKWCGNRLGKTMVRPFESPYMLTEQLAAELVATLVPYKKDFIQMSTKLKRLPSLLSRLERTGIVTLNDVQDIGAVGMTARASALERDIRKTHPYLLYDNTLPIIVKHHGDVYSRTQMRIEEVYESIALIKKLLEQLQSLPAETIHKESEYTLKPNRFAISLVEGWRGEICHIGITDADGNLALYKMKDPSFHNWSALELAVRDNGISDFPICNKSFNLSYCGHDL